MKFFLKPVLVFFLANLLISLPLYFFVAPNLGYDSMLCTLYFTIVWIVIEFLVRKALYLEIDIISIGLGLRIGLKFLLSMFFIGFLVWSKMFLNISSFLIFIGYYSAYTFLMLYYKEE